MNEIISKKYRALLRLRINYINKRKLKKEAENISILSSNCIGGVIYHELGMQFLSPTINCFIRPREFVRLCANPEDYFFAQLIKDNSNELPYPVGLLKDIRVFFNHAQSFEEAKTEWDRRKDRFNYNNFCIMMCERDGCTYDDIIAFDGLPIENKVVFVHKPMPEIKSAVYLQGTELKNNCEHKIVSLTSYMGHFTGKRFIDEFDYVTFLNNCVNN